LIRDLTALYKSKAFGVLTAERPKPVTSASSGNIRLYLATASIVLGVTIQALNSKLDNNTSCSVHPEGQAVIFDNETDVPLNTLFTSYSTELRGHEELFPEEMELLIGHCSYFTMSIWSLEQHHTYAYTSGDAGNYLDNVEL